MKAKSYPLHWFTLVLLTFGFLCNLLALILPYWYAKFPQSGNHFLNLGLWEVCFSDFMPESLGYLMYSGCFYLYDKKISDLWPIIFRTWFVVCQVFHTLSFITYVASEAVMLTQAFHVISVRGPRAVLFVIMTCSLTCLFVLVDLITMGVGVDNESKRLPSTNRRWLISLDQCTLSWSYGLSAFSFLGSFLTVIILSWFVYPKRSSDSLLTVNAWNWPNRNEILCQPQVNDLRISRENSRANSSNRSRSLLSTSADHVQPITRPLLSVRQPTHPNLTSSQAAAKMTCNGRQYFEKATPVARCKDSSLRNSELSRDHINHMKLDEGVQQSETVSIDYGQSPPLQMSSYDPRSADTVSLLSREHIQPVRSRKEAQASGGTVSEQSSLRTLGSGSSRTSPTIVPGCPSQEDLRRYQYQPDRQRCRFTRGPGSLDSGEGDTGGTGTHLSVNTLTLEGPLVCPMPVGDGGQPLSASSGLPETWSADSAVQMARPMKRRGSSYFPPKNLQQTTNDEGGQPVMNSTEYRAIEVKPTVLVQSARPMRRRH